MDDSLLKEPLKNDLKKLKIERFFGPWKLDATVSSRGQSKGYLAIFVECKTRFYIAVKIDNRTKDSMFFTISSIYNTLTNKLLKTFTVDRGKEFACY